MPEPSREQKEEELEPEFDKARLRKTEGRETGEDRTVDQDRQQAEDRTEGDEV